MRSVLLAMLFPCWVLAAPPEVKFKSDEVKTGLHSFVVLKAEVTNGKGVTQYKMPDGDGLSYLPSDLLADKSAIVFTPLKKGVYEFWAWSGNEDGASKLATVRVIVGDSSTPPPVDGGSPPDTTPPTANKFFFFLVRPDGPQSPETGRVVGLPAWAELRKSGHEMKLYTRSEVGQFFRQSMDEDAAKYQQRLDGYVGKLVVTQYSADGKRLGFVKVTDVPATDDAVKSLVK